MKKVILFIFIIILALVAVVLYKSSESFPKFFDRGEPFSVEEKIIE
ncbi:MAG: hypothetical protein QGG63_00265 [Candidatus Pacebacteria bacterium]|jgi:hypothetical protein|nr:hypothetical protein [Candidatus Paceibacterota bacterium]|tara:strand:+ start:37713 stop:37850 length:138 start_codon:yes stop_codon:yes gene_type:complete